jgi:hypothetical protein
MDRAGFSGWSSRGTVAAIEVGERALAIDELLGVAAYFEVAPWFILTGAGSGFEGVRIGNAVLSAQEIHDLITDDRSHTAAPRDVRDAVDRIWHGMPRPWSKRWRRGATGPVAFAKAREERLAARKRLPGPTYVVIGDEQLAGESGGLWGTTLPFRLEPGVPYVARDDAEADRLAQAEANGQVQRVKAYQASRMRKRGKR